MSDPLHLNELVRHPELGFVQTSRFFVLDASPNTPSVNTAAQTTSSSSSLSSASPQNIAEVGSYFSVIVIV